MTEIEPTVADGNADAPRRSPRWRRVLVAVFVILGCVLAPLSVLGLWVRETVLDTDRYVETVGPLIDDADVQAALARRISDALVAAADLDTEIADALPSEAEFIAPAVGAAMKQFVETVALELVQSDAAETLWDEANRRAHSQIVALLEGESTGGNVVTEDGAVVVRLGPFVERVQAALEDRGIDVFDVDATDEPEIVLIQSDSVESAQSLTDLLQKVALILPVLTLLAFAAAIALSGNRRRTVLRSAFGLALAMGLLLVTFNVGRDFYLGALPDSVDEGAAASVYDQILSFLRLSLRTAFVVALVVALAAWISGPSSVAVKLRAATIDRARRDDAAAPPSAAAVLVQRYKNPLRVLVVLVALAILVVSDAPSPLLALVIAIVALAALVLIELIGGPAAADESPG